MSAGLPPGPRAPAGWQALAWLTRPVPFLAGAHRRFGDVFTMRIPREDPWVVLAHPDAVREVFAGDPALLHAGEGNEVLRPLLGSRSVLLLDGRAHLAARRVLLPPFHGERLRSQRATMARLAEEEVARWPADAPLALAPRMQALTLEIILRVVFGSDDPRLRSALRRLLEDIARPLAFLGVLTLGGERMAGLPRPRRMLAEIDALIAEEVARHRADGGLEGRDDVLSMLLLARHEDGSELTAQELRDELMTLLVAGHETTATALSWAAERLVRHPEALARLADDEPGWSSAVAHETLRLRPVIPVVLRRLQAPMRIGGWDLPAGVKVAPCILLVHRRADVYPDPLAFRPERWLGARPGTATWIPFGGSVRRCLGASFALMEMEVALTAMARRGIRARRADAGERVARRQITLAPARGGEVVAA